MNETNFLKNAVDFVRQFVKEEYLLWQAETDVRRPKRPESEWFIDAEKSAAVIQERKIFQVKLYELPEFGLTTGSYLSSKHKGMSSYFELLLTSEVHGRLKIISSALSDREGYFDYHDGAEFEQLPKPLQVVKLEPPTDPADLEEYNAE
jgi:hypothetical protein